LLRIEKYAFNETGLVEMIVPSSVAFLGDRCFAKCKSLSSVRFGSWSKIVSFELEFLLADLDKSDLPVALSHAIINCPIPVVKMGEEILIHR
jgi:hypothetical protein